MRLALVPLAVTGMIAMLAASCGEGPIAPEAERVQWATPPVSAEEQPYLGRYIVVFKEGVPDIPRAADALTRLHGGTLHHVYQYALRGFSAEFPSSAVEALRRNPTVASVDENKPIVPVGHTTESNSRWGLDRIDQRDRPLNGTYNYTSTGSGVRIYIIDSGIRLTHTEFGARASLGVDELPGDGQGGKDCIGHGTEVAGVAGGSTFGTAKAVSLIAVRVYSCSIQGSLDDLIHGIDWVISNKTLPAVANISSAVVDGSGTETTDVNVDQAVTNLISSGVTVTVSAGNTSKDACGVSPAHVASAITVGATDSTDSRASFSNFGSCLDLFAPGVAVVTASNTGDADTAVVSGTSFSAPYTAGVAALYLQSNPSSSPSQVDSMLLAHATAGRLASIGTGSPNDLLHSIFVDASISGPGGIPRCGTYTWTAQGLGGDPALGYTYAWYATYQRSGATGFLGAGQTLSMSMCNGTGSFTLKAIASNLNSDGSGFKFVFNGF